MKKHFSPLIAISFALAGCSLGTPDCADDQTLDLIDQAVVAEVEKSTTLSTRANTDEFRDIADTYSISDIRMQSYDESIDSYQCEARITYEFKEREWPVQFAYRVDTEQGTGEPMIQYQTSMLAPITGFAMGF